MRWTSLDDVARLTDHFATAEEALAGSLGALARSVDDPALAPLLAGHAAHHAWHVELWRSRRPDVAVESVGTPTDEGLAPADLSGIYGDVVPALAARVRAWRDVTDASIDAPTARLLDLVLADLDAEIAAGRAMIQR